MRSIDSSPPSRETEHGSEFLDQRAGKLRLLLESWTRLSDKLDDRRSRLSWPTRGRYYTSGACYSLLRRVQHESHIDGLNAATIAPPVFLLGFWRSGTTLLHELFCCDPRFGFASTYACLNPSHFLLTERVVQAHSMNQQTRRPMDDMKYSWMSPQEDEFALLALGAPSPYEALLVPSLMQDPRRLLDLQSRTREEQERWSNAIQYFLRLLTVRQNKPMVLKSPPHGFRLYLLPRLFPKSKYVVIERNPFEVFASNLKLWRTLLTLYSLESFSMDDVENFVLAAYPMHEDAITAGASTLECHSFTRVRYEDLVSNPIQQMARLYEELNLDAFETARPRMEQHLASVEGHKRNSFQLSANQKQRVEDSWGGSIVRKGYDWPGDRMSLVQSGRA